MSHPTKEMLPEINPDTIDELLAWANSRIRGTVPKNVILVNLGPEKKACICVAGRSRYCDAH
jgi:hypothetical protein